MIDGGGWDCAPVAETRQPLFHKKKKTNQHLMSERVCCFNNTSVRLFKV